VFFCIQGAVINYWRVDGQVINTSCQCFHGFGSLKAEIRVSNMFDDRSFLVLSSQAFLGISGEREEGRREKEEDREKEKERKRKRERMNKSL
jgi:hypothetical protein